MFCTTSMRALKKPARAGMRRVRMMASEFDSMMVARYPIALFLSVLIVNSAVHAEQAGTVTNASEAPKVQMTAQQLFDLADNALAKENLVVAEAAYRALAQDTDAEIRSEAHFRLGMLLAALGRHAEAARLFRRILDEKPNAQRVRLELARVLVNMGDDTGARRALRDAPCAKPRPGSCRQT